MKEKIVELVIIFNHLGTNITCDEESEIKQEKVLEYQEHLWTS